LKLTGQKSQESINLDLQLSGSFRLHILCKSKFFQQIIDLPCNKKALMILLSNFLQISLNFFVKTGKENNIRKQVLYLQALQPEYQLSFPFSHSHLVWS